MSKLTAKLLKNSTIADTSILSESKFFTEKDMISTDYPMVNVALSGSLNGGLVPGITQLCGPSKHFKSMFALLLGSAYLKKYPDSTMLFYDTEYGSPISYFETFGIDETMRQERVVHTPILNVEELKIEAVTQLDKIDRGDKVVMVIDSIGNLASLKELEDAKVGKTVADVGNRAKALKSLFRMITPYFVMKDIPCIVVNHSYKTLEMFSKDVVAGGTGSYYSSENIWMIGRQQEKVDKELLGYNFIIKVEKSRYVKEGSKIPFTVLHEGGCKKWSGMIDLALEGNFVTKVGHKYSIVDPDGVVGEEKYIKADIENDDFWNKVLADTKLAEWIKEKYSLGGHE